MPAKTENKTGVDFMKLGAGRRAQLLRSFCSLKVGRRRRVQMDRAISMKNAQPSIFMDKSLSNTQSYLKYTHVYLYLNYANSLTNTENRLYMS